MNDYNNGTLPDPCLRLDYGFGEQWASVELGDGTGYVRLADYEKVVAENAKLRELVRDYDKCLDTALYLAGNAGYPCMPDSGLFSSLHQRMRELGIEVKQ